MKEKQKHYAISIILSLCLLLFTTLISATTHEITTENIQNTPTNNTTEATSKRDNKDKKNKKDKKPFKDAIKNHQKSSGLFDIYINPNKNSVLIAIKPKQFNKPFLFNITRNSGEGNWFDSASMQNEFPFRLEKIGKMIQLVAINTYFRAPANTPEQKAVENSFSDSLIANTNIISNPDPNSKAVLIKASDLFINDTIYKISKRKQEDKTPFKLKKKVSYIEDIKTFPNNTEIDLKLNVSHSKSKNSFTLPDPTNFFLNYHISIASIPTSNYTPRVMDDRLGYFETLFQDFDSFEMSDPHKRYINRWNLEKTDPSQESSTVKKPIIFWLENTIPEKYRPAITQGVLAWNNAFEKIGLLDAIQVKQMPQDATFDPADSRYNVIRWFIHPDSGYAVGPSRSNPWTGELYDADIRVSADFIRFFSTEYDEYIDALSTTPPETQHTCSYATSQQNQLQQGWNHLNSNPTTTSAEKQQFIHDAIVDLLLHETGHTLGLRHNFKASTYYTPSEIQKSDFTAKNGITGSVMDYNSINPYFISSPLRYDLKPKPFQTIPGTYDMWAIKYGYGKPSPNESENDYLKKIIKQGNDYTYCTDEDARGKSMKGSDPYCQMRDISSNPLITEKHNIALVKQLWQDIPSKHKNNHERYQELTQLFFNGFYEYKNALTIITRFVGGTTINRNHMSTIPPLKPVSNTKQRDALKLLQETVFNPEEFTFEPDLINLLAKERRSNLKKSVWKEKRLVHEIHPLAKHLQKHTLSRLFSTHSLNRILDNELRSTSKTPFTLPELFNIMTDTLFNPAYENPNSFHKVTQELFITQMDYIITHKPKKNKLPMPYEAKAQARHQLKTIRIQLQTHQYNPNITTRTKVHYNNLIDQITQFLNPKN